MSKKAKHQEFQLPPDLGRDWMYCRPIGVMRAKQVPDPVSVLIDGEYVDAEAGDYVLVKESELVAVLSEDNFNSLYTVVPPSKMDTHFNQRP